MFSANKARFGLVNATRDLPSFYLAIFLNMLQLTRKSVKVENRAPHLKVAQHRYLYKMPIASKKRRPKKFKLERTPTAPWSECPLAENRIVYHVTPRHCLRSILQHGLIPMKGPRSEILREPRPAVYFFANKEVAYDAVCGWLGDVHPSSTTLVCLAVTIPSHITLNKDPNFGDVELYSEEKLPPEYILSQETL
jgi:hypothetical protein